MGESSNIINWIVIGIIGVVSCIALGLGAYAYHITTSGSGEISTGSVRSSSLTVGGSTTTNVAGSADVTALQTGTYNLVITYFDPAQPGVQQTINTAGGTFSYTGVTVNGAVQHRYLELSTFSYTFNAIPTATNIRFIISGLSPTFMAQGLQSIYLATPYTVTLSTTGESAPITTISVASSPSFQVLFYSPVLASVNSGFQISTTQAIRVHLGTLVL